MSTVTTMTQNGEETYIQTFFCRALYDYQSQDASSLSFSRGDIIEVLTQLESGWWDGLLNDERGWFPSNYVVQISDQEAEAELAGAQEYSSQQSDANDSGVDVSQIVPNVTYERDNEWLKGDIEFSNPRGGMEELANAAMASPTAPNDFWVPQVTQTGQIFYVNTQTGERSRDLPSELPDDFSDGDVSALAAAGARGINGAGSILSRKGRPNNKQSPAQQNETPQAAGFGLAKRNGTPEPWMRRLADDGLSYFYFNKNDGRVQWTRPEPVADGYSSEEVLRTAGTRRPTQTTIASSTFTDNPTYQNLLYASDRLRSDSVLSQQVTNNASRRLSVYSDDSDIQPRDAVTPQDANGRSAETAARAVDPAFSLTTVERAAMELQERLAYPEPETIEVLADMAKEAIIGVMHAVDANGTTDINRTIDIVGPVNTVVVAVRNLLYVSFALSGPLPNNLGERVIGDPTATAAGQQLQAHLKTSQRKVTATLSKLVLSARTARYKRDVLLTEMMIRVEQDASDLQRALEAFVQEVQKQFSRTAIKQFHARVGRKRLRGVLGVANLGLGLPGAGVAASWRGFGFVGPEEGSYLPTQTLNEETLNHVKLLGSALDQVLSDFSITEPAEGEQDVALRQSQEILLRLLAFLNFATDIHVAQHVDIDGIRRDQEPGRPADVAYMESVAEGRAMIRSLEVSLQSMYDEGSALLVGAQEANANRAHHFQHMETLGYCATRLRVNRIRVQEILESLHAVGHRQAEAIPGEYRSSIEWRMSRLSILDGNRRLSTFFGALPEDEVAADEDVIGFEHAFRKAGSRPQLPSGPIEINPEDLDYNSSSDAPVEMDPSTRSPPTPFARNGAVSPIDLDSKPLPPAVLLDDELTKPAESKAPRATKIRKFFGDDAPEPYIDQANADAKPWYLRADYGREDILVNPDGGVRAGTLPALVERLTTHEYADSIYNKTFLMTYASFTSLQDLFDLLVQRFHIQPPQGVSQQELEEWRRSKQLIIRMRVLNTFKTMVTDDDILEQDDLYILDRMRAFVMSPDVIEIPAAKNLVPLIHRAQVGDVVLKTTASVPSYPPPSIIPKTSTGKKLKLLDIDPLEMARQLTILESRLYNKIRPRECLTRAREQKVGENKDHIAEIIQVANRIAYWVADSVLSKEDSRKRAAIVKQFIVIADRCRTLHNFSSMAAIIAGLNSPPIRRLKRTWEQVGGRFMSQLGTCESTLDSNKNFTNYKTTLARTNPPCVPFIGVYLTVLTFIQDGSKDVLPGNLINFGKRQKAAEVIREIKNWQSKPFNLAPLAMVLAFLEESLLSFSDSTDWSDFFWNKSLEREPREREDEKMARLLQESGFL